MSSDPLLASLQAAVEAAPGDVPLRLHLAQLLERAGQRDAAVRHAATVLAADPTNAAAMALLTGEAVRDAPPAQSPGPRPQPPVQAAREERPEPDPSDGQANDDDEVLRRLDAELSGLSKRVLAQAGRATPEDLWSVEEAGIRLADVGGMTEVKARLEAAVLAPMRHPELRSAFAKTLRGGLLLYGPPGCGKTFLARALAGEMDATFLSVSLADVLNMFIGQSERNVQALFETAREHAPCVVFLDEIDALGHKRAEMHGSGARGSVNQLLTEMDGISSNNTGVFVLGATNSPWDVDVALRRPGRFDRMLLVLPPDEPARESILAYHLRDRPTERLDLRRLAKLTEGYSGADLAYLCESATEEALLASSAQGRVVPVGMAALMRAATEVRPSIGPWLETARNVAQFSNSSGAYDELAAYLRRRRMM